MSILIKLLKALPYAIIIVVAVVAYGINRSLYRINNQPLHIQLPTPAIPSVSINGLQVSTTSSNTLIINSVWVRLTYPNNHLVDTNILLTDQ